MFQGAESEFVGLLPGNRLSNDEVFSSGFVNTVSQESPIGSREW